MKPNSLTSPVKRKPIETAMETQKKPNETAKKPSGNRVMLGAAVKLTGVSKSTLHKAMESGKLHYEKDENGHRMVQVAELERVYGSLKKPHETALTVSSKPDETGENLETELLLEKQKVVYLECQIKTLKEQLSHVQIEKERWYEEYKSIKALPSSTENTKPVGFFKRLFGA